MNIGIVIKKLRKEKLPQINQREFAKIIGISQTYMSQIESGVRIPNIGILQKIANELVIPLGIMFWYSVEEIDIHESKRDYFNFLKPNTDKLIDSIY